MKDNGKRLFTAVAAAAAMSACALTLEEGFKTPPNSAKPHTWYHMMNGNVTKEGITCDFEALARAGIGGVQMFDAGCAIPPGKLDFNSPEWFDMFKHAAQEARRLGLEICIPNCSGWSSSGGPWNMPSNGMKKVVFTETPVRGPAAFKAQLPRTKNDNGFYEDIAVLAFPTPPADLTEFPDVKADLSGKTATLSSDTPFTVQGLSYRLEYRTTWSAAAKVEVEVSDDGKAFKKLESFTAQLAQSGVCDLTLRYRPFAKPLTARAIRLTFTSAHPLRIAELKPEAKFRISDIGPKTFAIRSRVKLDEAAASDGQIVRRDRTVDLTSRLAADGTLAWDVPAGDWTILRIGYICNGRCNHPASDHGRGLEVDKLSASAMDYHFDQYVTRLCKHLGPLAGNVESGFNNILVDSYEVGSQNWTQGFDRTFERRMGYSLKPYLPVFTGRVVGSVDESERFLEDFRRVVADLFAENYAGRLAELCHRHGLLLSIEPYGNSPSDNLQYGQDVDIPMGEFWSSAAIGDHCVGTGNAKFPSYLAHVWGRRYAATESFTADPGGGGRWQTTPFTIKAQGDRVFAQGINRIIYHRFTHQPWPGNKYLPGMTMGRWGMHLDRTQTWWDLAGDWFRYQSRCQWMLQEGTFVADALFFCGEQAPNQGGNTDGAGASDMTLPAGYDWDICATKAMELLKVKDGRVVAPGGVSYALLVLPPRKTMSERMLATVERLLDAGAKVCGLVKPTRAPGLRGYPLADARLAERAEKVWAKGVMECRPAEALERLGVAPDFTSTETDRQEGAVYIHRRNAAADWYFVALNNVQSKSFEASFRATGRQPEIWDAEKGTITDAPQWHEENGRTVVTLDFPPSGSAFVVFRRPVADDHVSKMFVDVSRRPDPTPPSPPHTLVIENAVYGVSPESTRPDCADVRRMLKPGERMKVTNTTMGGDPANLRVKELEVVYRLAGKTNKVCVKEHGTIEIPAGAEVESAWYGVIDPAWRPRSEIASDITAALSELVKDGSLLANINNRLAKGDPAPMQHKEARITYIYDGVRKKIVVKENYDVVIPSDRMSADPMPDWTWLGGRLYAAQPLSGTLKTASGAIMRVAAEPPPATAVAGEWSVTFPVDWYTGGTAKKVVAFPSLADWAGNKDPDIRFFSGTATYTKRIPYSPSAGERTILDLGTVKNFAVVAVNGKAFPVLWKPPYRVDITDALDPKADSFSLEVKVTNLWPNRLIGDDAMPEDCDWRGSVNKGIKEIGVKEIPQWVKEGKRSPTGRHTFTTWRHWSKDEQLLPSGLLGPVIIRPLVHAVAPGRDIHTKALTPISEKPRPAGGPMALVKGGRLNFAIVADKAAESRLAKKCKSPKSIEPAIRFLVEAFEKTVGQKPEVLDETETAKIAAYPYKIVVGACKTASALEVDPKSLPMEGFAVKTFPGGVLLVGRDTSLVEGWNMGPLERNGTSCGTKIAALDFAERFLGVRYFAPGEYGTYWPKISDLVVEPVWYEDAPLFKARGDMFYPWTAVNSDALVAKWTRALGGGIKKYDRSFVERWRGGRSLPGTDGTHCPRPERMMKSHPDKLKTIFYTSPYGKFWMNPGGHVGNFWNVMDLGFADIMIDDLRRVYASGGKDDPGGYSDYISSANATFGCCDTYMPVSDIVDDPTVKRLGLVTPKDIARDKDAAMANIYGRFFQYLGSRVKETFPGKKLSLLAYYNCKCAPDDSRWRLPDNVEVMLCDSRLPARVRSAKGMEKTRRLFGEWRDALGGRAVRRAWLYTNRTNPFARAVIPEFVGEVPKVLGGLLGEGGVFFDCDGGHDMWNYYWAMYVNYRAQWNWHLDVDAAIDEHWDLFYGPVAGPHLREFHRILKKAYLDHYLESDEGAPLYPVEVVDSLEREMNAAADALDPATPEGHRIRLFTEYWPTAFRMMRARAAYKVPVYCAPRAVAVLDDAFWGGVPDLPLFDPQGKRADVQFPASVKLAWRDDGVYGRFRAAYPSAADPKRDIWAVDSCEMFFMPGLKKEVEYQMVFDVLGRLYTHKQRWLPIPQPIDGSWRPPAYSAKAKAAPDGWTCDFFVPFAGFEGNPVPKAGDEWNFNFVRNKLSAPREVTGNSLTLGSNHNRAMFGILRFL